MLCWMLHRIECLEAQAVAPRSRPQTFTPFDTFCVLLVLGVVGGGIYVLFLMPAVRAFFTALLIITGMILVVALPVLAIDWLRCRPATPPTPRRRTRQETLEQRAARVGSLRSSQS